MIPLTQKPRDCWRTALASVLEIDVDELPEVTREDWWETTQAALHERGWHLLHFPIDAKAIADLDDDEISPGYWVAVIRSFTDPENWTHAVVFRGRELVHDPSTERLAMRDPEDVRVLGCVLLVPLDPARAA